MKSRKYQNEPPPKPPVGTSPGARGDAPASSRAPQATPSRATQATPSRAPQATPSRATQATPSRATQATPCLDSPGAPILASLEVYESSGRLVAGMPGFESEGCSSGSQWPNSPYNIFEDPCVVAVASDTLLRRVLDGEQVRLSTSGQASPHDAAQRGRRSCHGGVAYPLFGESGSVTHFAVLHHEQGSRIQANPSLPLFKRFADGSGHGCAWLSLEGLFVYANRALAELAGAESEGSLVGEPLTSVLAPEGRDVFERIALPQVLEGRPWSGEVMLIRRDGTPTPSLASLFLIQSDSGAPTLVGLTLADLSARAHSEAERAKGEAQLQRSQKLDSLGVLAGGIAHDFNNLLCGIIGNTELAMQSLGPDHTAQEDLALVLQTSQRAAELCQQMLAYSGRSQFVVEPIDLSQLIHDVAPLLRVSLHRLATLELQLAPGLPRVEGDATQLRQVVVNLVMNASEALGGLPGRVRISTGQVDRGRAEPSEHYGYGELCPGPYAFVDITDSGPGMEDAVQSRIFEPFFTTKFTGRGLGLPAALGIVRGHRGAICVESRLGHGTTLRVLLPCIPRESRAVSPGEVPKRDSTRGRVLLVDDEPSVRTVGRRMLDKLGFEVITAEDGPTGVQLYTEAGGNFDLVLLDMTMPGQDGSEVWVELQRVRPAAKVILMSGYTEKEATEHFTGTPVAFLAKPFRLDTLAACVDAAMGHPSSSGAER